MAINSEQLKGVLERTGLRPARQEKSGSASLSVNNADEALVGAMLRLLRLLDTPADIPALAPLIEEEVLYRLLQGPTGHHLLDIAIAESAANRISKAIAWLKQNYMRPVRMEDLGTAGEHERFIASPQLQGTHGYDAAAIPETATASGG